MPGRDELEWGELEWHESEYCVNWNWGEIIHLLLLPVSSSIVSEMLQLTFNFDTCNT